MLPCCASPACVWLPLKPPGLLCYSQVTLLLSCAIWCWCSLQTHENCLLPRAVKQPESDVRARSVLWKGSYFRHWILKSVVQDISLQSCILHYFAFCTFRWIFLSAGIVSNLVLCTGWTASFLEILKSPYWATAGGKFSNLKRHNVSL